MPLSIGPYQTDPQDEERFPAADGWKHTDDACKFCEVRGRVHWRDYERSDHDDEENRCGACGRRWIVDGDDG